MWYILLWSMFPKPTALTCELKKDMDLERLPFDKFDTHELVQGLVIVAYNDRIKSREDSGGAFGL